MIQELPPTHPPSCRCDACQGTRVRTPRDVANPPGKSALRYRVGRYRDFFESMKARLSVVEVRDPLDPASPPTRPLEGLTSRSLDDPTIALLEASALVGEVLTFYDERIANEAYLPTAEEGRSLAELARLVGYRPRPGVAATVPLAFELEVGSKPQAIPAGSRAQSVPSEGEDAQMFETLTDIPARREWNNLTPLATRQQLLLPGTKDSTGLIRPPELQVFFFKGVNTRLSPNDPLLLLKDKLDPELWRVTQVEIDQAAERTTVVAVPWLSRPSPEVVARRAAVTDAIDAFNAARDLGFVRRPVADDLVAKLKSLRNSQIATMTEKLETARKALAVCQAVIADVAPVNALADALNVPVDTPPSSTQRAAIRAAIKTYFDVNGGESAEIAISLANRIDAATGDLAAATLPAAVAAHPTGVSDALSFALSSDPAGLIHPLSDDVGNLEGSPEFVTRFNTLLTRLRALAAGGTSGGALAFAVRATLTVYIKSDPVFEAIDAAITDFKEPSAALASGGTRGAVEDDTTFLERVDALRTALNSLQVEKDGTSLGELLLNLDSETIEAVSEALVDELEKQLLFLSRDTELTDRLVGYLTVIAVQAETWVAETETTRPDLTKELREAFHEPTNEALQNRLGRAARTRGVNNLLPTLRREALFFEGGAYPRLKPSFDRMLAKLESINEVIRLDPATVEEAEDTAKTFRATKAFQIGDPALAPLIPIFADTEDDTFGLKTAALWKNPGLRDASGRIPKDPTASLSEVFGSDSERAISLLASLAPDRAVALRAALANADIREPLTFALEAPRAVAAPFGTIAGLRAFTITKGETTETVYEDWPLYERILEWSIPNPATFARLRTINAHARIAEGRGGPSIACEIGTPTAPATSAVPPFTVTTLRDGSARLSQALQVRGDRSIKPIEITFSPADAEGVILQIKVEGETVLLRPGESFAKLFKPWDLKLSYRSATSAEPATLRASAALDRIAPGDAPILPLDAVYDQIVPGSHIAIQSVNDDPQGLDDLRFRQVKATSTVSISQFGITSKVTELKLDKPWLDAREQMLADLRRLVVFAQGEALELDEEPYDADVRGQEIILDSLLDDFEPGRFVLVEGERTDIPGTSGVRGAELVRVQAARQVAKTPQGDTLSRPRTLLVLTEQLRYSYRRDRTNLYANVAIGGHGETRPEEILGGGDPSRPGQRFVLKQKPLTYTPSAETSGGAEPALSVRVDGVLWHRADDFSLLGPTDRAYVLQSDGEGGVAVSFGDGINGARPSAGSSNIKAVYRVGLGLGGNALAGQISQLVTRPQGVMGVTNPMPATGGAGAEPPERIRRNAPAGLLALDRLVSAPDVADFARAFAGVAKAFAVRVPIGLAHGIHLTIAAEDDAPLNDNSTLVTTLTDALRTFGDPSLPILVQPRKLKLILVEAALAVDPGRRFADVEAAARARMLDVFGFENRALGQDVSVGAVVAVLQGVPGVLRVVVEAAGLVPERDDFDRPLSISDIQERIDMLRTFFLDERPAILPVAPVLRPGRNVDATELPAELAYLSPNVVETLVLKELRP
jgi:predicted phage baseplate assembly protein